MWKKGLFGSKLQINEELGIFFAEPVAQPVVL